MEGKHSTESLMQNELYIRLLKEEKDYIFDKSYEVIEEKILEINSSRKTSRKDQTKFPTINKKNLKSFFSKLKKEQHNKYQKDLKNCLIRMNSSKTPLWITPVYIIKAINECVLNRKWNNLTELLLILLSFPPRRYKPIIRHICQIMDKLHPVIHENGLEGQFAIVQLNK